MTAAWSLVVGVPVAALLLLGYALRPRDRAHVTAPLRLAAVRAALAVGAYAVLAVEVAGAFGALTRPVIGSVWLAGAGLAAALAAARRRRDRDRGARVGTATPARAPTARAWLPAGRLEWLLVGTLGALLLAEASLALLAEPNNYDSQTYHLPRVEHWVAQRDVGFYPTAIHRQVTLAPGAEYLLLHLRLLTGGDALHHLVQWAAGLGCLLVASRIAAQLGGSRIAQIVTAFVVGTTPMVVLQASSTQNDLVAAAWTACVGTLALDGLVRRATAGSVLSLGTAVGLTAITKNSGLLAAGPLLALWAAGQFRQWARRPATDGAAGREPAPRRSSTWQAYAGSAAVTAAAAAGALVVAAALVGPFMTRIAAEFDHPLGPPVLRES
ncbi:MAG TPA: hypothetical protein VFR67_19135, partial [Pilimelia sp.]|nr:hypothetical protein [Pilimelia sp.]